MNFIGFNKGVKVKESNDFIDFNSFIKSSEVDLIRVSFDDNVLEINLVNGEMSNNGEVLYVALSEIELSVVGLLKPKIFRRTRIVLGDDNEANVNPSFYFGWVTKTKEAFVVLENDELIVKESR